MRLVTCNQPFSEVSLELLSVVKRNPMQALLDFIPKKVEESAKNLV
jgi:hypothetical protein